MTLRARTSLAEQRRQERSLHEIVTDWKRHPRDGYLAPYLDEECRCGGTITAANLWGKIADAVRNHNLSTRHQQWRRERGL